MITAENPKAHPRTLFLKDLTWKMIWSFLSAKKKSELSEETREETTNGRLSECVAHIHMNTKVEKIKGVVRDRRNRPLDDIHREPIMIQ